MTYIRFKCSMNPIEANVQAKVQIDPNVSKALNQALMDAVSPFTNDKINDVYGVYDW